MAATMTTDPATARACFVTLLNPPASPIGRSHEVSARHGEGMSIFPAGQQCPTISAIGSRTLQVKFSRTLYVPMPQP